MSLSVQLQLISTKTSFAVWTDSLSRDAAYMSICTENFMSLFTVIPAHALQHWEGTVWKAHKRNDDFEIRFFKWSFS